MKLRMKWLPKMTPRGWILLLMMITLSFVGYASPAGGAMLMYGILMPVGIGMAACSLKERQLRRNPSFKAAAVTWIVCAVTAAISGMRGSTNENIQFLWMLAAYSMFVMIPPKEYGAKDLRRELMAIGEVFTCVYLPFALLALFSVFTGRLIRIPFFKDPIGLREAGDFAQRIRIFMHPNGTSEYAALIILFCIYSILNRKSLAAKLFFGLNIFVNLLVLVHAQSRASTIALGMALGMIAFRGIWLCPKLRSPIVRACIGALAVVLAVLGTVESVSWMYRLDVSVNTGSQIQEVRCRTGDENKFDVTYNNRDDLWGDALQYMLDHPQTLVAGMGFDRMKTIDQEYPGIEEIHGSLHNSLLEVLAICGLIALLAFAAWLITLVAPCLRVWLSPEGGRGMFIVPIAVAMLMAMSLAESILFVNVRQMNFFFYLLSGYAIRWSAMIKRGEIQKGD